MKTKTHPKCSFFFFCFWSVCVLWLTKGGVGLRQRYAGNAFALFGILFQHFNAPTTVAPHSQTNTLRSWTVEPSGRSSPQMELSCTEAKSLLCNLKRVLSVLACTGMLCGIREHISISNHSIFDNPLNFKRTPNASWVKNVYTKLFKYTYRHL